MTAGHNHFERRRGSRLQVVHIITGLSRGGAENVLYRLIQAQPNPSQHSVVSLMDEGIFGDRLKELGVEVRCLGLRRGRVPSPLVIWRLLRWLRQLRPDLVQTWMYHADLLGGLSARLAGVPVFWGLRNGNLDPEQSRHLTLRVARLNACLSRWLPTRIVSCSVRAVEIHRALGYADKFVVIPNGLDLARFTPVDVARRGTVRHVLGLPEGLKVIGHLGRPDPQKDHATLLKVFARVAAQRKDVCLLLAGLDLEHGSPYLDGLLARTKTSGLVNRIMALGQRDDVPDLMAVMDVFFLSSTGEAFPNVVVEAMACGTPCVVTDVGDSAEIVGDAGWTASPGDVGALADALLEALGEQAETHALRRQCARRRIEENFSIERMVKAYREVWEIAARVTG